MSEKSQGRVQIEQLVDQALARAVLCRTLRLGFQYPTEQTVSQLLWCEGRQAVNEAARFLDKDGCSGVRETAAAFAAVQDIPVALLVELYTGLFGHTARGRVCPYGTEYGCDGLFRQSQELADIRGYYMAFGLEPRENIGERADHIAVEWEFLEFLSEKEAYALVRQDSSMLEETCKAYRSFLRDHLARFGRAFAGDIVRAEAEGLFGALGRLCDALLLRECRRLGVAEGPQFLALRPESLDDAPLACESGSDLVQLV